MSLARRTIVLIPTYNESANIGPILDLLFSVEPEIMALVIDDHSPDGTADRVRDKRRQYPRLFLLERQTDRGFARSYLEGFRHALADPSVEVIVTMDADFSHEPKELPSLLALIADGTDVAIGSRHARGGSFPGIPLWRHLLSRWANRYARLVLRLPIADCTAGYMAIRADTLRSSPLGAMHAEGYGFLFELKDRLVRSGASVVEHPVSWPNRHQGSSKMSKKMLWESALLPWKIAFTRRRQPASVPQPPVPATARQSR